jgi:hypothetical protein
MCCNLTWKWHFAYACVGVFIGVSVLFSFFQVRLSETFEMSPLVLLTSPLQLNNPTAAYWGLCSGIFGSAAPT